MKSKIVIVALLAIFIVLVSGCVDNTTPNTTSNQTPQVNSSNSAGSSSNSVSSGNTCPECNGKGMVTCYNTVTDGPTCYGTGTVQGGGTEGQVCRICSGTGEIICPRCGGSGQL